VNPTGQRRFHEITHMQRLKLRIVLGESTQLGLFVVFLVEEVETDRRYLGAGADTRYLRSKIVGLVAGKRRITHNLSESLKTSRLTHTQLCLYIG